jgi:DNA-binding Lrp family transcriptional regulator
MRAYILLNIRTGEIPQVINLLNRVNGVIEANMTFGPYDAVAVVDTEDIHELGKLISKEIQPIPGIIDTLTCLAIDL